MEPVEPFYIRQTVEAKTPSQKAAWIRGCADEAMDKGAKLCRASQHDTIPNVILFEAWDKQVWEVGDQGEPRFNLIAGEHSVG